MKVAFITSYYEGDQLDAVTTSFFKHVVSDLKKAGHETVVFALGDRDFDDLDANVFCRKGELERYNNLHSLACAPVFSWVFSRAYETYRAHRDDVIGYAPDVVLCVKAIDGMFWSCFEKLPVALMSVTPQFEIMRENFDGNFNMFDTNLVTAVETAALRSMSAIGCPSEIMRSVIVDAADIPEERIDLYRTAIEPIDRPQPWSGKTGTPHIVYVGTQERYKGIDVLVNAIPSLVKRFPQALFTVAGESPPLFGETVCYRDKLRAQLEELDNYVEWLPALDAEQRASLHAAADISVFPFRYCGCMYHVAEAMSVGAVVVCSGVGTLQECLEDGVNSVHVAPDNDLSLAGAISDLVNDKAHRDEISKAAKDYVRTRHAKEDAVSDVVRLCDKAISNAKIPTQETSLRYWIAALEDYCAQPYLPELLDAAYAKGFAAGVASVPAPKRSFFSLKP